MSQPRPRCRLPEDQQVDTYAVRGGQQRTEFEEMTEPIFLTQGFVYDHAADAEAAFAGELNRFTYSRYGNPTVSAFEERLRLIEKAPACFATSSGMSAIYTTLIPLLRPGARVVAARALFGTTFTILDTWLKPWGVHTDYVDAHDLDSWREALATPADVVLFESPSNPMQDIVDIPAVSELAHAAGAQVIVDNVFATPILQRPIELGADIVVYSTTKHIDGQGRVVGGAILGQEEFINGPIAEFIQATGPTMSAFNAWVLLKGLETLPVRIRAQNAASLELATWLENHPAIAQVRYPYLPSHPQYELAQSLMSGGGSIVTFDLNPDCAPFEVLDALEVIDISNNLGDVKSMVTHPATTTHRKLGEEGRKACGIGNHSVRLSVGLEEVSDLKEDLNRAFGVGGLPTV